MRTPNFFLNEGKKEQNGVWEFLQKTSDVIEKPR